MKPLHPHHPIPLASLLIKPAGPDCNLACAYCFYTGKASLFPGKTHRMSDELLAIVIKQAMSQARGAISFGWQGGEPTLMGLDFFQTAIDLEQRHASSFSSVPPPPPAVSSSALTPQASSLLPNNALQTNGLLLDDRWARFLARHQFLIGLSIDGAEHVHDRYRRDAGGHGTWSRVRDRARMLLDAGAMVNALAVVNDYSVRFAEETYDCLKQLGLTHLQFIPCLEPDPVDPRRPAPFSVSAETYADFLIALYRLWRSDFKDGLATISVRFFDDLFHAYVGLEPPDCALLQTCGVYLTLEHNGDVYPCDFFVEPARRLGNVKQDLLSDLLNSPAQRAFAARKADLPADCHVCRWRPFCHGGCPRERGLLPASPKLNHLCSAYRAFFAFAHDDLTGLAHVWRQAHPRQPPPGAPAGPSPQSPRPRPPGRNDPCPCGSGKKFKKCCGV